MSDNGANPNDPKTTGHVWDGIEEFDNPLPRWWLWVLYATIIWGIGYSIWMPAWPLLNGTTTAGIGGYSSRADVAADIKHFNDANAAVDSKLASVELDEIAGDEALRNYATNGGAAIFRTWCAQCHGEGAGGFTGYPNLVDNDWLWGGTLEDIHTTISHGIREPADDDTHLSDMPKFGEDLESEEIDQVVQYVLSISGQEADAALAEAGAEVFVDNCEACHAEGGTGNRDLGAPNLTDAIWLYGGDAASLRTTITYSRAGVMPAWAGRLSESQIRQVAFWVHQQGGGE